MIDPDDATEKVLQDINLQPGGFRLLQWKRATSKILKLSDKQIEIKNRFNNQTMEYVSCPLLYDKTTASISARDRSALASLVKSGNLRIKREYQPISQYRFYCS